MSEQSVIDPELMKELPHLGFLNSALQNDFLGTVAGEEKYRGSWLKRGGIGAFMMLARKWDRLEALAKRHEWDIIEAVLPEYNIPDGPLDDIRDLRRYLLLVECEILRRAQFAGRTPKPVDVEAAVARRADEQRKARADDDGTSYTEYLGQHDPE